eukprot:TRINITY_DN2805_c0_g1_i2.p1 TRINITY_DN2805_c0_g1~~TRINITY_DN2805_c0_g1_i2.p1  ORF type:complete len:380 (+),score=81.59 TRINITY_DN2805_c0_g1_i2:58-1197(+)
MAGLIAREVKADITVNTLDFATNMDTYMDNLFDPSSVVKANALEKWIEYFKDNYYYQLDDNDASTLIDACMKGITRQDNVEMFCDFLVLIAVTLGDEGSIYGKPCVSTIRTIYENPETSDGLKIKYIKTLCVLSFIWCSEDIDNTMSLISELFKVIEDLSYETSLEDEQKVLLLTTLHSWTLLVTLVDDDDILAYLLEEPILPAIGRSVINSNDYHIQYAAGKALSYISVLLEQNFHDGDIGHYDYEFETEEVLDVLRLSKKPKRYNGITTSQIVESMQGAGAPTVDLVILNNTYSFSTWLDISRIDTFRSILKSGFLKHLESNELLSLILGIEVEGRLKLTTHEKKMLSGFYEAKSKHRDRSREQNRSAKQAMLLNDD